MTVFQCLLKMCMAGSINPEEVKEQFIAYKNKGVGVSIGLLEGKFYPEIPLGSKEDKLYWKISDYSYEFHRLDDNLEYVHPENEFK